MNPPSDLHTDEGPIRGGWWACERPEGKFDVGGQGTATKIDTRCRACVLATIAHLRLDGVPRQAQGNDGQMHDIADTLEAGAKLTSPHSMILEPVEEGA